MMQLLLEIGTEELPASFLAPAARELERRVRAALDEAEIPVGTAELFYTPRRVALRLNDVPDERPARVVELQGPPKRAAFDPSGDPTKTGIGFSAAHGKTPADLYVKQTAKGEYVFVKKETPAVPTTQALQERLPDIIESLPFPKNMRWDATDTRFARPIRWLVCLLGTEPVRFKVGELEAGADTFGLRNARPLSLPVESPAAYETVLLRLGVIALHADRRQHIEAELKRLAATVSGEPILDEELLEETADITESPELLLCSFKDEFLKLPAEVLTTALKKHQRCFAVRPSRDMTGSSEETDRVPRGSALLPRFIAVTNTPGCNHAEVTGWYEKAAESRLRDARFFVDADLNRGLEALVEDEKQVVWIEGMGSYFDKTQRLRALCRHLSGRMPERDMSGMTVGAARASSTEESDRVPTLASVLDRAALLCKADLLTNMVREKEFTSLQGRMGGIYARLAQEPDAVADAIAEHYLPNFVGDSLPQTLAGALLSVADKMDNIVATFLTGEIPTGSEDPFATRRQTTGLLTIILERRLPVDVAGLLTVAVNEFPRAQWQHTDELPGFFKERLASTLANMGISYDAANAVAATSLEDPRLALARARAIEHFRGNPDFEKLIVGQKRVANILKGQTVAGEPDDKLLSDEAERTLWKHTRDADSKLNAAWDPGTGTPDFERVFSTLLELRPDIDRFFDDVLVMDKDEAMRANRLRLLAFVREQFLSFADLSQIVLPGDQKDTAQTAR